jgi:serine/threonine protein phosphatase PrpC
MSGWIDAATSMPTIAAHFEAQGMRPTMEDAVIMRPNFPNRCQSLYAVLDGHGGSECSADASDHWPPLFSQALGASTDSESIHAALNSSLTKYDADFLDRSYSDAGSTAVCVFHNRGVLHCANIGDSRAVLCRKQGRALDLSDDHKADRPDEQARMERVGGFVRNRRALGTLAVSRALGDGDLKRQVQGAVIATPEIQSVKLEPGDEFILIACDGVYDVMSSQEAVTFIRQHLFDASNNDTRGTTLQKRMHAACRALVNHAINVRFSTDNVSVVVVCFDNTASCNQQGTRVKATARSQTHTKAYSRQQNLNVHSKNREMEPTIEENRQAYNNFSTNLASTSASVCQRKIKNRTTSRKPGNSYAYPIGSAQTTSAVIGDENTGSNFLATVTQSNPNKTSAASAIPNKRGVPTVRGRRGAGPGPMGSSTISVNSSNPISSRYGYGSAQGNGRGGGSGVGAIVPNRVQKQRARTSRSGSNNAGGQNNSSNHSNNGNGSSSRGSNQSGSSNTVAVLKAEERSFRTKVDEYKERLKNAISLPTI